MILIISYGLVVLSVGETIIFTIIIKKSTGENLLERVEKDELLDNEQELEVETESTD